MFCKGPNCQMVQDVGPFCLQPLNSAFSKPLSSSVLPPFLQPTDPHSSPFAYPVSPHPKDSWQDLQHRLIVRMNQVDSVKLSLRPQLPPFLPEESKKVTSLPSPRLNHLPVPHCNQNIFSKTTVHTTLSLECSTVPLSCYTLPRSTLRSPLFKERFKGGELRRNLLQPPFLFSSIQLVSSYLNFPVISLLISVSYIFPLKDRLSCQKRR